MRKTLSSLFAVITITGVISTQDALAALTVSGTIPPGGTVVVIPANPRGVPNGILKLKLSSPAGGAHLGFCLGDRTNPCGLHTSFVVGVAPGEQKLAVINAGEFSGGAILVVGQGTRSSVGYSVSIE